MASQTKTVRRIIDGVECICYCPVNEEIETDVDQNYDISMQSEIGTINSNSSSYRERNTSSLRPYIRRMSHGMEESLQMSEDGVYSADEILLGVMDEIATQAAKICEKTGKKTISYRDIQFASKIVLPKGLYEHASRQGDMAMSQYNSSFQN